MERAAVTQIWVASWDHFGVCLSVFQFTLRSFVPVMSRATTPPLFSPLFSHVWQISFLLCSPEKRGEKSLNENTWVQLFLETLCVWEVSCQRRFHAWHFALSSTGMLIAFMKEEVEGKSHTHTHTHWARHLSLDVGNRRGQKYLRSRFYLLAGCDAFICAITHPSSADGLWSVVRVWFRWMTFNLRNLKVEKSSGQSWCVSLKQNSRQTVKVERS